MRVLTLVSLLAALPLAAAQAAGDQAAGQRIVETWCAPCHAMSGRRTSDLAPTIGEILAARSAPSIAGFLNNPHGQMPNIQLSRRQIEDVTAFLQTLRK